MEKLIRGLTQFSGTFVLGMAVLYLLLLSGCAQLPALAAQGASAADAELATAEWAECELPRVGAWVRRYGNDPTKAAGWKAICNAPITQTPAKP